MDEVIGIITVIFCLISGCNLKSVNQLFYGPKVETVTFCSNAPAGSTIHNHSAIKKIWLFGRETSNKKFIILALFSLFSATYITSGNKY
jgi:hypothetical protein